MGRLNIDKGINTSYSGPQIQFNPYKNPNDFFFFGRDREKNSNIHRRYKESQGTPNHKTILKRTKLEA